MTDTTRLHLEGIVETFDRDAAIRRIEESRATHVEWRDHLRECEFCKEDMPSYVHPPDEQEQIIAEYDNVLAVLRADVTSGTTAHDS
jgi:hypothetical protein